MEPRVDVRSFQHTRHRPRSVLVAVETLRATHLRSKHRRGETVSTIGQLRAQLANLQVQIDEAKARTRAEGLQKIKAIMTIAGLTAPTKKRGPKAGRSLRNCGYQKLWGLARACLRETK